jgi:hypothetical protein
MAREPKRIGPAEGYLGEGGYANDGPPSDTPPLYRAGRAVPPRSQPGPIGPAAGGTRAYLVEGENPPGSLAPRFTNELRSGVEMDSSRGTGETQKTAMEFGDRRRERRGVRTRPLRPGQWA